MSDAGILALESYARSLRSLARVPSQAATEAAKEIGALIQQEFDAGIDPYGDEWAPLAEATIAKGRRPPPLTDTGALREVTVQPMQAAGIQITLGAEYGAFHQIGTVNMPARPPLPNRDLPDTWRRAIADAVDAAAERIMGGP